MSKKIYLHLLILCGTLFQGIIPTLSDEDVGESSDFLVRKRRVINHLPDEGVPVTIENANYMVVIQEHNRANCAGVILSHFTVLTLVHCIREETSAYKILSGGSYVYSSRSHLVTSKVVHYGNLPHQQYDGIALLTVHPPFEFNERTGRINLYGGLLPVGSRVNVFGWGCIYPPQPGPHARTRRLRSIHLPIMNHGDCNNIYQNIFDITEKYICTYDQHQYCARTDAGAPLVFNNSLAGIHVWKGEYRNRRNPDVFLDLRRDDYRTWILENTHLSSVH